MTQMLSMATRQDCHPMTVLILTEVNQPWFRRVPPVRARFAIRRGRGYT